MPECPFCDYHFPDKPGYQWQRLAGHIYGSHGRDTAIQWAKKPCFKHPHAIDGWAPSFEGLVGAMGWIECVRCRCDADRLSLGDSTDKVKRALKGWYFCDDCNTWKCERCNSIAMSVQRLL